MPKNTSDKTEPIAEAKTETAPAFKCPNDGTTKFHKAEFGELRDGEFVGTQVTYRCVGCHTEYAIVDGAIVKA